MASHPSGWGAFAISGGVYFASDGRGGVRWGIGAGGSLGSDTSVSDIAGDVIRGRDHSRGHIHGHVIRGRDSRRVGGRRFRNKTQGISGRGSVGL